MKLIARCSFNLLLPLFTGGSFFCAMGQTMQVYNMTNSPLPDNSIHVMAIDTSNALWIGTDNGLVKFYNGIWSIYDSSNSGLTDNYIRALSVSPNGTLWIGTTLGGLFSFDGSNWAQYNTSNSGIPDNFIRCISAEDSNTVWVGTVEGFARLNNQGWTTWNMANAGLLTNNITSIKADSSGLRYIGTINGGMNYMNSNIIQTFTIASSGIPDNSVLAICLDLNNKPWFASTSQGLFTDTGNQTWLSLNVENSAIPTNSLTAFSIDSLGNFLIGTHMDGFVIRTVDGDWINYNTTNSSLPESHVLSVIRGDESTIWIGTYSSGLVKLSLSQTDLLSHLMPSFHLYPNPANGGGSFFMESTVDIASVSIIDPFGRTITSENFHSKQLKINAPKLPGLYVVRFKHENQTIYTTRLLVY
jgi:ligand-binding sensor domain-containing protein